MKGDTGRKVTYQHSCNPDLCSRFGEQIAVQARIENGVFYQILPRCVESGADLQEVKVVTW